MNRNWIIIFTVLAIFSIKDAFFINGHTKGADSAEDFAEFDDESAKHDKYSKQANDEFDPDDDVEIRAPTGREGVGQPLHVPLNAPPLKFAYCVSCGYKQAFDQFSQIVTEKFPGINIEGGNYPPTTMKALAAQFLSIAKMVLIVSLIFNRNPFEAVGMQTPGFFVWMTQNKVSACMMLFLFSNSIEGMLMSTGAFEIYLGDELIWSKLESGRIPAPTELIQAIESHLELSGAKLASGTFGIDSD
ncbi:hypothetical protein FO519_004302 [Halicephalobus sp. NKZ332]|nr:hypothetical protein FO519_004302 [Halicephalobus sp. NKZ332]